MSPPTTTNSVEAGGRVYKRRPGACETCKIRKRKCDGGRPSCEKCLSSASYCVYLTPKKRGRSSQSSIKQPSSSTLTTDNNRRLGQSSSIRARQSFDDLNAHASHPIVTSTAADHVIYAASSSTPSSLSGIDQLLENTTVSHSFAPQDDIWVSLGNRSFSSAENIGILSNIDMTTSPGTETLENGWTSGSYVQDQAANPSASFCELSPVNWVDFDMSSQQLDAFEANHAVTLPASSNSPRHLPSLALDMVKLFLNRRRNLDGTSSELIARLLEVVEECFATQEYLNLFDDMGIPSPHVDTHFQFIQAFLSQPYLGAIYVSEIEVSRLYQEVILEGVTDPAKRALVFASMAIGNLNYSKSSRSSPTTSNDTGGSSHYQEALLAMEKMFVARPSILVFKALLTTSLSDAFIDHNPLTECDKTGVTATFRDFHAHCRLSQLCSRMSEDLHVAGDVRDPNSGAKVSDRAEKWIVVLQRFNSEVLETRRWEDHIFAWTPNSTHSDTSKLSVPVSSYPSKLFLFEMALFAHGRLFQKAGTDISLDKSEHIVAQFASEVLNVIVNMDPSTTSMNRHFVQVAVSSFCITAVFAQLHPDQAAIFKQLVSTLGLFARVSTTSSVVSLGKLSSVVDSVQRLMTPDTQRSSQGV
ncbi:hypothetical protein K456DRAFT_31719 [Colletotrichum gloeosporioides 23]|nr:hypothetical protein K456DRAFT_31719 [Colletotrichum gloeosporioides 23]